jgi:hypothetical protein
LPLQAGDLLPVSREDDGAAAGSWFGRIVVAHLGLSSSSPGTLICTATPSLTAKDAANAAASSAAPLES